MLCDALYFSQPLARRRRRLLGAHTTSPWSSFRPEIIRLLIISDLIIRVSEIIFLLKRMEGGWKSTKISINRATKRSCERAQASYGANRKFTPRRTNSGSSAKLLALHCVLNTPPKAKPESGRDRKVKMDPAKWTLQNGRFEYGP